MSRSRQNGPFAESEIKGAGKYGTGWGTVKPKNLDDDTDCSGAISGIHWTSWGGKTAHGTGVTCPDESKPSKVARIKLEPTDIRVCKGTHHPAYSELFVQFPNGHGGYHKKQSWLGSKNICQSEQSQA